MLLGHGAAASQMHTRQEEHSLENGRGGSYISVLTMGGGNRISALMGDGDHASQTVHNERFHIYLKPIGVPITMYSQRACYLNTGWMVRATHHLAGLPEIGRPRSPDADAFVVRDELDYASPIIGG
ncbi:hypothetical protein Pst134EA_000540 [Puccinia striiformis f. sp. tritici]|uniref:hypothetical protein n=1 Tax=Puccinia striiformis f. sp. tritici TaxID=168172 RepID=UPI002008765C|nr:hypothetical protein Pst134EA_000540 [Puccinia striiformis f. sp. tritici]KAH9466679.1 hypothetical protein Pst134EB_001730 [Puccinia striiformis f. sp. tritici]KAH9473467.1 hypothetical protein Pst134EA_000540 [Puccinia striiformis f. sp. tritici]KAI9602059.1 hypothetical protein KEM48_001007 [Puccinia striiformis f. sp. tritici PST-130]